MTIYKFGPLPTGGAVAETTLPSGTEVQFVGTPEFVLMGMRRAGGDWAMTTVTEPRRFGDKWDTVRALKAWVLAYEAAAA
jgi:hypothetical protein